MGKMKTPVQRSQGFEALRDLGESVTETVNNETKQGWNTFWKQMGVELTNQPQAPKSELTVTNPFTKHEDVFDASKHHGASSEKKHAEKAPKQKEAAYDHNTVIKSAEIGAKNEMRELNQRFNEIKMELQKLINSSNVLKMEFGSVTVDQAPKQVGVGQLNFLDFLLKLIHEARANVGNADKWKAAGKKKGNKGRWGNKQRQEWFSNTSVSMSNESGGGYINQTG